MKQSESTGSLSSSTTLMTLSAATGSLRGWATSRVSTRHVLRPTCLCNDLHYRCHLPLPPKRSSPTVSLPRAPGEECLNYYADFYASQDNFGDDRALFDAVIASKETDPVSGETVTALFDLRPEDTGGRRVNNAYWVPFNMTTRCFP